MNYPLIVSRSHHPVSRKNIHSNALKVLYRLHRLGFKSYLVGGCVRDFLLGKTPKDFDVATNATPGQIRRVFNNCVLVGRRFRVALIRFRDNHIVEVSTLRRNPDLPPDGTLLLKRDNTYGTEEEDALRRDLTINGLFYDIATFSIIDYVGGIKDLQNRIIQTIGDPNIRFREDPVRMIRACRHAARTGFVIHPNTRDALERLSKEILLASPNRILEEMLQDLRGGYSRSTFNLWMDTGLMKTIFPGMDRFIRSTGHAASVFWRALELLDELRQRQVELPVSVLLSTLSGPVILDAMEQESSGDTGQLIKRVLEDLFTWVRPTRSDFGKINQMMVMVRRMMRSLQREPMPSKFKKRQEIDHALLLCEIFARSRNMIPEGDMCVDNTQRWKLLGEKFLRPVRKKSRRRALYRRRRGRSSS
ncbi:MAG: hypothetical protein JRI22_20965 [Deltaproteobacteria bacterium]|nr:hypothetical protein [Deltaproteobacteria bacterium]